MKVYSKIELYLVSMTSYFTISYIYVLDDMMARPTHLLVISITTSISEYHDESRVEILLQVLDGRAMGGLHKARRVPVFRQAVSIP